MWNHCTQEKIGGEDVTKCKYCSNAEWKLGGSTSSALYHLKTHHSGKLTHEELFKLNEKSHGNEQTTPESSLPVRSPKAKSGLYRKIAQESKRGRELNIKLLWQC